jgi:hypothetical protein
MQKESKTRCVDQIMLSATVLAGNSLADSTYLFIPYHACVVRGRDVDDFQAILN